MSKRFLILASSIFLVACFTPDAIVKSEHTATELVGESQVRSRRINAGDLNLHYVVAGEGSSDLLVFIHGTPGDWTIFAPQFESQLLINAATLVGLDRPGWGLSAISRVDNMDLSLAAQSKRIGPILAELRLRHQAKNLVLVGHSLGGSLVPRLAMDFPDDIDGVIVLAGDLTHEYPAARWYNEVASWKAVSWLLPEMLIRANKEVLVLEDSLRIMMPLWVGLTTPLLVVQGAEDGLVDPRHADFAENLTTKSTVFVERFPDTGHLIHLDEVEKVNAIILRFLADEVVAKKRAKAAGSIQTKLTVDINLARK